MTSLLIAKRVFHIEGKCVSGCRSDMQCFTQHSQKPRLYPTPQHHIRLTHDFQTLEVEAGRWCTQGHPWLHSKLKASLGYIRPCLKDTHRQKYRGRGREKLLKYQLNLLQRWITVTWTCCLTMVAPQSVSSLPRDWWWRSGPSWTSRLLSDTQLLSKQLGHFPSQVHPAFISEFIVSWWWLRHCENVWQTQKQRGLKGWDRMFSSYRRIDEVLLMTKLTNT